MLNFYAGADYRSAPYIPRVFHIVFLFFIIQVMLAIRTSLSNVQEMEIAFPYSTYATEHLTVPMDTTKIPDSARPVSELHENMYVMLHECVNFFYIRGAFR